MYVCHARPLPGSTTIVPVSTALPGHPTPLVIYVLQVRPNPPVWPVFVYFLSFLLYWSQLWIVCSLISSLSWWPPGTNLGHSADATSHWRPHPGLHCWGGDQQRSVGIHAAWLDRHLLQQLPGDPACLKPWVVGTWSKRRQTFARDLGLCSSPHTTAFKTRPWQRRTFSWLLDCPQPSTQYVGSHFFKSWLSRTSATCIWCCYLLFCLQGSVQYLHSSYQVHQLNSSNWQWKSLVCDFLS